MKTNQKGFSALVLLVILVALGVIGFAGWSVWKSNLQDKHSNKLTTTESSSHESNETNAKPDLYANWKIYTSGTAGYSIKYPSDWSVKSSTNNGGAEDVSITSPDNYEVKILSFDKNSRYGSESFANNPSGKCSLPVCMKSMSVEAINVPRLGAVKIDARTTGSGGGTINELVVGTEVGSIYVQSPLNSAVYTTFLGIYQGRSQAINTDETLTQFVGSASAKTATLIYESLSY